MDTSKKDTGPLIDAVGVFISKRVQIHTVLDASHEKRLDCSVVSAGSCRISACSEETRARV